MKPLPWIAGFALVATLFAPAPPASAQAYPPISARTFTSGSVTVRMTGQHSIREEIAINVPASFGDGEVTWIQFGVSGSDRLDALITYGENQETGITISLGKVIATGGIVPGETSACSGKAEVTATLITGSYTCRGLTSQDPATGVLGKVDMTVAFTAKS